jgi:hypothetical protein
MLTVSPWFENVVGIIMYSVSPYLENGAGTVYYINRVTSVR